MCVHVCVHKGEAPSQCVTKLHAWSTCHRCLAVTEQTFQRTRTPQDNMKFLYFKQARTHTRTHIRTHTRTCTYTHIHAHTCTNTHTHAHSPCYSGGKSTLLRQVCLAALLAQVRTENSQQNRVDTYEQPLHLQDCGRFKVISLASKGGGLGAQFHGALRLLPFVCVCKLRYSRTG